MAACYASDVEVFHPMTGLEQHGVEAFRKAQEWWFSTVTGPVDREVSEFRVRVDESVAFSHALVRMRATLATGEPLDSTVRVTTGYRAAGDRWYAGQALVTRLGPRPVAAGGLALVGTGSVSDWLSDPQCCQRM
jgi:ketosteroid isomerase-like protein